MPLPASGGTRRTTSSSGLDRPASTAAVPSVEPSSITRTALFRASTASRRVTLSAIVASSFSAGTRNTHRNSSAAAELGSGAERRAERESTNSTTDHTRPRTMIANAM